MKCLGYVKVKFTWGEIVSEQIVYICRGIKRALLGKPAIRDLGIAQLVIPKKYACAETEQSEIEELVKKAINENDLDEVDEDEVDEDENNSTMEDYDLLKEFPQLYNRLGKIEVGGPINIKIKEGTTPHQTYSPRHIPLPQMQKVIEELKKMKKTGCDQRGRQTNRVVPPNCRCFKT